MKYTDENLMNIIDELFQKMRQQNAGGEDRRTPYMQRKGTPDRRIGCPDGRTPFIAKTDRKFDQHPPMDRRMGEMGLERNNDDMVNRCRPPMARERVLRMIGMDEPINQSKLAAFLCIRPQSLSELLVKLEKDGYIIRIKNEQDKRETLISLTEMGRERSKDVESARAAQLSEFLMPLTADEREQLFNLIRKLLSKDDNVY